MREGTTTTLISDRDQTGTDATTDALISLGPSVDGTRIVFRTTEQIVESDTDAAQDAFLRDTAAVTTTHVTDRPLVADANLGAGAQHASADLSRVFFYTFENMAADDTDGSQDGYLFESGAPALQTDRAQAGPDAPINATPLGISDDGSRFFFRSDEPIVAADTDASTDIYERAAGATSLVTDRVQAGADEAVAPSGGVLSRDGTRVYFQTAEPLVAGDTDALSDVYVAVAPDPEPDPDPDPTRIPIRIRRPLRSRRCRLRSSRRVPGLVGSRRRSSRPSHAPRRS